MTSANAAVEQIRTHARALGTEVSKEYAEQVVSAFEQIAGEGRTALDLIDDARPVWAKNSGFARESVAFMRGLCVLSGQVWTYEVHFPWAGVVTAARVLQRVRDKKRSGS